MDIELENRSRSGQKPFDGKTLAFGIDGKLSVFRKTVSAIWNCLKESSAAGALYCLSDMHEFEGIRTFARIIKPKRVDHWMSADRKLWNSCDKSHGVAIGLYPEDYSWYFRFNIDGDDINNIEKSRCNLDLSGAPEVIDHVLRALDDETRQNIDVSDSARYFTERYDG